MSGKFTRRSDPLRAAVRRYCRDQQLLTPGTLVVAVSGGADSVCLLHVLHDLAPETGLRLHVAHFNHNLRGEDSAADARLVAALADRLDLAADFGDAEVAATAVASHRSLEAAAHDLRWSFLEGARRRSGAFAIATGHTADDQAETVLMHLLRGSGLRGLAGMAPSWGSARRPLLAVRHDNCVTWCREHDVPWREDASNAEVWCRRNAIRWEVLPFLRRYNPEVDAALAGLAGAVQSDLAYLDTQATAAYRSLVQRADGGVEQLALAGYLAMPAALRHRVLLLWLGPNARRVHVHAVDRLLRAGRAGEAIAVPGGRQVVKQYDDAILVPPTEQPIMPVLTITVPGETRVPGWSWTIRAEWLRGPARQDLDRWSVDLDAKRVQLPLTLRGRRAGDRFLLPGLAGAKKLQDMLVDAKMPRRERDRLGIVEAANGIVWLAGWRAAAWAAADTASERILRLSVAHSGSRKQE